MNGKRGSLPRRSRTLVMNRHCPASSNGPVARAHMTPHTKDSKSGTSKHVVSIIILRSQAQAVKQAKAKATARQSHTIQKKTNESQRLVLHARAYCTPSCQRIFTRPRNALVSVLPACMLADQPSEGASCIRLITNHSRSRNLRSLGAHPCKLLSRRDAHPNVQHEKTSAQTKDHADCIA